MLNEFIAESVAGEASNLRYGSNPPFTSVDFLELYPQFTDVIIPSIIVNLYIDLANSCIKQVRFRAAWKVAMCLFVAHFCTLWISSSLEAGSDKDSVINSGQATGILTSESVDGISYSMDVNAVMQDLDGFASWKSTTYGIQLATLSKMYGKGGIMII